MNRRRMAILLASLLMVVATGCGKNAPDPSAPAGGTASGGSASAPNTGGASSTSQGAGNAGSSGQANGNAAAGTAGESVNPAAVEKVSLGPLKLQDLAQVGPVHVTLNEAVTVKKGGGLPPGYFYLLLNLTVKNEGTADYTLNVPDFAVASSSGSKAPYNPQGSTQRNPKLQGTVQPGQEAKGWLGFMAKTGTTDFTLTFTHPDYGEAKWNIAVK